MASRKQSFERSKATVSEKETSASRPLIPDPNRRRVLLGSVASATGAALLGAVKPASAQASAVYTILSPEQEELITSAGIPADQLAFLFFVNKDGGAHAFLPSDTDPAVRDITTEDFSRNKPLVGDGQVKVINKPSSANWQLVERNGSLDCYGCLNGICWCCRQA